MFEISCLLLVYTICLQFEVVLRYPRYRAYYYYFNIFLIYLLNSKLAALQMCYGHNNYSTPKSGHESNGKFMSLFKKSLKQQ